MSRDRSAGLLDLGLGARGHRDAFHDELPPRDLAGPEQFDRMVGTPHQPGAEQRFRRHLDTLRQEDEVAHIHHLRRLLERIREAALGNAPDERHLPALESRTHLAALARGLAFAAAAGRLADSRAGPAALADARAMRALRRLEIVQREAWNRDLGARSLGLGPRSRFPCGFCFRLWTHFFPSFSGVTSTRCRTCWSMPRSAG